MLDRGAQVATTSAMRITDHLQSKRQSNPMLAPPAGAVWLRKRGVLSVDIRPSSSGPGGTASGWLSKMVTK